MMLRDSALVVVTTAWFVACSGAQGGATAAPQEQAPHAAANRIETIPNVDLSELTTSEKRVFHDLANQFLSPCGEPVSVARCAVDARTCSACVPSLRYVARLITDGLERAEIETQWRGRYSPDETVQLETDGLPLRGSPMARITIVEFSDFECPYCGRAHPIVAQALREFEGQVRLYFRNYPLSAHPHAAPAARAAVAAGNQDKFWEMHDQLFEHQHNLEDADIERYAVQIGLNMERFRADLAAPETQAKVDRDREVGHRAGVEGTPTLFINGRRFRESPASLLAYLREELER